MGDDDYEIVPIKELHLIKDQLKELKSAIYPGSKVVNNMKKESLAKESNAQKELIDSISKLTKAINQLTELFKAGKAEIESEKSDDKLTSKKILPLTSQFDTIIEQNKAIAKGILLLVNLLSGKESEKTTSTINQLSNIHLPRQNQQFYQNQQYSSMYPNNYNQNNNYPKPTLPPNTSQQQEFNNVPPMPSFLRSNENQNQNNINSINNFKNVDDLNKIPMPPQPNQNFVNQQQQSEASQTNQKKKGFFGFK